MGGRKGKYQQQQVSLEAVPCSWLLASQHRRTEDALGSIVNANRLRSPGYDSCTGLGWASEYSKYVNRSRMSARGTRTTALNKT